MKSILFLTVISASSAFAQFTVGQIGMTIKSGSILSVSGLSLTPSSDLQLAANSLEVAATPIPGSPTGSINRVYRFSSPVNFSGTAMISYKPDELNGNTEGALQISQSENESTGFIITSGSAVDVVNHSVFNTISSSNLLVLTATGSSALPVTLIDFMATAEGQSALLNWATATEINSDHFEIEHSLDVKTWNEIGEVGAKGESAANTKYQFVHNDVADGANYYRLKMLDHDGTYATSQIRSVIFKFSDTTVIFPNPAAERIQLKDISKSKISGVGIYDVSGKLLYENTKFPNSGVELGNLPPGSYVLKVNRENGQQSAHNFVKQ